MLAMISLSGWGNKQLMTLILQIFEQLPSIEELLEDENLISK